jgi:hypothetical protein
MQYDRAQPNEGRVRGNARAHLRRLESEASHRLDAGGPPRGERVEIRPGPPRANARYVDIEEEIIETVETVEIRPRPSAIPRKSSHLRRARAIGIDARTGDVLYDKPKALPTPLLPGANSLGRDADGHLEMRRLARKPAATRITASKKEEKAISAVALKILDAEKVETTRSGKRQLVRRRRTKFGTLPVSKTPPISPVNSDSGS